MDATGGVPSLAKNIRRTVPQHKSSTDSRQTRPRYLRSSCLNIIRTHDVEKSTAVGTHFFPVLGSTRDAIAMDKYTRPIDLIIRHLETQQRRHAQGGWI